MWLNLPELVRCYYIVTDASRKTLPTYKTIPLQCRVAKAASASAYWVTSPSPLDASQTRVNPNAEEGLSNASCQRTSLCQPLPRKRGAKRRFEKSLAEAEPKDTPLTDSLRRDWATGKIYSPTSLEYARGAKIQGAGGLGKMA